MARKMVRRGSLNGSGAVLMELPVNASQDIYNGSIVVDNRPG